LDPAFRRSVNRVSLFIALRGSLAADQTARMLQLLLATLAVWMAVGRHDTVRSGEPPADLQSARPGSELRHRSRATPARPLPERRCDLPRRHLDLGDARLLFLRRGTQPGSAALRVLAGLGRLAPRTHSRHEDSGWLPARRAGIYGSRDERVESEVGRGPRFVVELPLELANESETFGVEVARGVPSSLKKANRNGAF
jgi:hypothetical protein